MDNNNVENYNRKKNEDFKRKWWRRDRDKKKKSLVSKVQQIFRPSNQLAITKRLFMEGKSTGN